jgi:pyruvate kinase
LAKIDTIEALHNFEDLIRIVDGIVVNRSELGLELPAEKMMLA